MRKGLLTLAIFLIFSLEVKALEFELFTATFILRGEFETGDTERLIIALSELETPPAVFFLSDSPGGDLDEAMKIGLMLRASNIPVWAGNGCFSACVFALISGVERYLMEGDIGLHRPAFDGKYFSKLTSSEASLEYRRLIHQSTKYLVQMDAPTELVERMFKTDSGNIDLLTEAEKSLMIPAIAPYFEEWISAKCGSISDENKNIYESISTLRTLFAEMKLVDEGVMKSSPELDAKWEIWAVESGPALDLINEGVDLEKYSQPSAKHAKCSEEAVRRGKHVFMGVIKGIVNGEIENPWGNSLLY